MVFQRANRSAPSNHNALVSRLQKKTGIKLTKEQKIIPDDMTFRQWCEKLGQEGLKVDNRPFRLDNRPAMAWIYDQVPSTKAEAFRRTLVIMKCAQVGFTVMEMLATIYLGIKFGPATVGMFLPDQNLADIKSSKRFIPIVRTIPSVHSLMTTEAADGTGKKSGEGNVRVRNIAEAMFVFSWTSGRATTESIPMDVLSLDEVQEMTLDQMEKTRERLSASDVRFTLMGSTANWPESDIHHWYRMGTQHEFHTECAECGVKKPLLSYFPNCIKWDPEHPDEVSGMAGAYRYVCEAGHWIDEPQRGEWIAGRPENAAIISIQFPQMLSPTISPGELMQKYMTSTNKKNFHNRVLGQPFLDPSQVPVTLEHMARCVQAGVAAGVKWKARAKNTYCGIDQMGNFCVVIVKERLPDGRQAVIHVEEIYHENPFARCDEIMEQYGVAVCVLEQNPNFNDAHAFAKRHDGRVFLCNSFGSLPDEIVKWGDAPKLDVSERRTDDDMRMRYSVRVDQYRSMQLAMSRFTANPPMCLWPDPQELSQTVIDKGVRKMVAIAPRAFFHFTKTALVVEKDEETNQFKRFVKKISIDPHFSYANQLCEVAWARAHGTATFIIPPVTNEKPAQVQKAEAMNMHGLPAEVVGMMAAKPAGEMCGNCVSYPFGDESLPVRGICAERNMLVQQRDPGCPLFLPR